MQNRNSHKQCVVLEANNANALVSLIKEYQASNDKDVTYIVRNTKNPATSQSIGKKGATAIAEALKNTNWKRLKLFLSANTINEEGGLALASAIKSRKWESLELHLNDNLLTTKAALAFAALIPHLPTGSVINVSHNIAIQSDAIVAFMNKLKQPTAPSHFTLDLSGCVEVWKKKSLDAFFDMLTHASVKSLHLKINFCSYHPLNNNNFPINLADSLKENACPPSFKLSITDNCLALSSIHLVVNALKRCTAMVECVLISPEIEKALLAKKERTDDENTLLNCVKTARLYCLRNQLMFRYPSLSPFIKEVSANAHLYESRPTSYFTSCSASCSGVKASSLFAARVDYSRLPTSVQHYLTEIEKIPAPTPLFRRHFV